MSLDEYIFGKFADYLKRRKKRSIEENPLIVRLDDIKGRLNILARAVTGKPIDIYPAEREGGYKNNSFFLPESIALFPSVNKNLSFYLYRILYLSIQRMEEINWKEEKEYSLQESQQKSLESSTQVLTRLFEEFPLLEEFYIEFKQVIEQNTDNKDSVDYSFLYGKWMKNSIDFDSKETLKHINEKAKRAIQNEIKTIRKAKPVEEITSTEVDKKQQEEHVLQHYYEKVETAEEYNGGGRDFDGEDDMDKHSNALDELKMKQTVRVDEEVHSVYQAEFTENTNISESKEVETKGFFYSYDEWDYSKRIYKNNFCKVYPKNIEQTDFKYYKETIAKNSSTLLGLRKMLSSVNNKYQQQRRQTQGEEFDIDAITDLYVDVHTGHTPSEKIYLSNRKKEKDISISMLLDVSLSSDSYAAGNRVIDVEKQVSILFGEILNEYNVDFSIDSFYSKTRNYTHFLSLKDFDEDWNKAKHKIGTIEPVGYTRIGAALRHAGARLEERDTKNKWFILISDGKPNDYDRYEGKYGIEDVKQALRELNQNNINSYALAIEAEAKYYLPQMFGANHYQILTTPVELLEALVKLYEKIKHQ